MIIEGCIERIIWSAEDGGYTVLSVSTEDGLETLVGDTFGAAEGMHIKAEGDYVNHSKYDVQFKFTSCELSMPTSREGVLAYLSSGVIKGIGEVLAKRIIKLFKDDTLRIIEEEPERLAEVNGISIKKAMKIAASYSDTKEFRDVIIFLSKYGIAMNLAMKIYKEYGDGVYSIIKENPYKIAEDVPGVGFKIADGIARRVGIEPESEYRLRSCILYVLTRFGSEGHMYVSKSLLMKNAIALIRDEQDNPYGYAEYMNPESDSVFESLSESIENQLVELVISSRIVIKTVDEEEVVYTNTAYFTELQLARKLADLQIPDDMDEEELDAELKSLEEESDIHLDEVQYNAVKSAITSGVCVVTGGPGTGKTTITDAIIKYFSNQGYDVMLCAPTGRAAKRMTEQTGWPSQTIHRLLEFNGDPGDDNPGKVRFMRNEANPLETDCIIVDEMSMVDSYLFLSLLKAIMPGTRLILVGDVDQLPSVGPGNVLKDIIASGAFPVTTLTKIYRQNEGSDIVYNAHRVNRGEHIEITNKSKDFFFLNRPSTKAIIDEVRVLISDNLPKYLKCDPSEIQVLTPMRKNEVGVDNMNKQLQDLLNPKTNAPEKTHGDRVFRIGDKVMQIKNNYRLEWIDDDGEEGVGVFNGDVGTIRDINDFDEEIEVLFDDGRTVIYSYGQLDELEHAYAITIHKSQGSEYKVVILPLLSGPPKLMNRNLLYTAITRAKHMVVVVGNINMVNQMVDNVDEQKRNTTLDLRIQEVMFDIGMEL